MPLLTTKNMIWASHTHTGQYLVVLTRAHVLASVFSYETMYTYAPNAPSKLKESLNGI